MNPVVIRAERLSKRYSIRRRSATARDAIAGIGARAAAWRAGGFAQMF